MSKPNERIAFEISRNTLIGNVILSGFKLLAGIFANSAAMVSDAIHSMSDVLSTVIVIVGVRMSNKKSDREHQYGHERMECVAAIILAVMLFATGIMIGRGGIGKIISGEYGSTPGVLALAAAAVSIAAKEGMYWYTVIPAKRLGSGALKADAWHHRSDALSSVGSLLGILGARLGFPVLDPIACVVICVFILKVSVDIFLDSIGKMTDKACDDDFVEKLRACILAEEGVCGIDQLQTRIFGDRIYVDVEISADGKKTLFESHAAAERVHDALERGFPKIKHCMVHVNPAETGETEKTQDHYKE